MTLKQIIGTYWDIFNQLMSIPIHVGEYQMTFWNVFYAAVFLGLGVKLIGGIIGWNFNMSLPDGDIRMNNNILNPKFRFQKSQMTPKNKTGKYSITDITKMKH